MEKKIEDYLHLYIGCYARSKKDGSTWKIRAYDSMEYLFSESWELLLRPLSDMTEDECYYFDEIQSKGETVAETNGKFGNMLIGNPDCFQFLLSRGFDLFNLIPEGLAIDKTKVAALTKANS